MFSGWRGWGGGGLFRGRGSIISEGRGKGDGGGEEEEEENVK